MAVLEGVEGIPVLFVAWDQPDVFRLGTGFEFQTLVRNCLKCQRKYCFLQLNAALALTEWLTTFYLETLLLPWQMYIFVFAHGKGGRCFLVHGVDGGGFLPPAQGLRREGCSALGHGEPVPCPQWFSLSPARRPAAGRGNDRSRGTGRRGTKIGCGLPAIHTRRAHLKPGETKVFSARQSPLHRGKKRGAYMMLSAELFINRDIFRTFSWVSAAR